MTPLDPQKSPRFGPYAVRRNLGPGVYLCRAADGRRARLLTAHVRLAGDPRETARRLVSLRRVHSRWIVPVLDADPAARVPWVATAWVSAPSLASALRSSGPLPARVLPRLAFAVAGALAEAHRVGFVWGRLTPGEVLLTRDGPLLDVVSALYSTRPAGGAAPPGVRVDGVWRSPRQGVPPEAWVTPEELSGRPQGPSADLFRLGLLLAYAATGRAPIGGAGRPVGTQDWLKLAETVELPEVPERMAALIRRCLAPEPADRPTAAEVVRETEPDAVPLPPDFLDLLEGEGAVPRSVPARRGPSRAKRKVAVSDGLEGLEGWDDPEALEARPGWADLLGLSGLDGPDAAPADAGRRPREEEIPPEPDREPAEGGTGPVQPAGSAPYALGDPAVLPRPATPFAHHRPPYAAYGLPGEGGGPLRLPRPARQALAALVLGALLVALVLALPKAHGWWWPAVLAAVWVGVTGWGISAARRPTWAPAGARAAAAAAPPGRAGARRARAFLRGLTDPASFGVAQEATLGRERGREAGREGSMAAMLAAAYDRLGPPPPQADAGPGEPGAGRGGGAR